MASTKDMTRFQKGPKALHGKNRLLAIDDLADFAKLDIGREMRRGLPEIILAEGKEPDDVAPIAESMLKRTGRAIISRANKSHLRRLLSKRFANYRTEYSPRSKMIIIKSKNYRVKKTGGKVGILTAGTSDIPIADEAKVIAEEMGCETRTYNDVGVAGLHRLFKPLRELLIWDVDVMLVIAGREGALPTVVAGIVNVPIIGVPTSRSYGFGEKGIGALAAMLQSCSLGLAVVNIDGGVGAGSVGALIANRAALGRKEQRTRT